MYIIILNRKRKQVIKKITHYFFTYKKLKASKTECYIIGNTHKGSETHRTARE